MVATARSLEYLYERLNLNGPDLLGATTALSKFTGDLLASLGATLATQASNYAFADQLPDVVTGGAGGTVTSARQLFAGVPARVRFNRVPDGVNGSDVAHYVYIVGGGGASEAVLITGGAGTSGQRNGEITFTPANNHGGAAWTVSTATAGVAEAANISPYAPVQLPMGIASFYAPVTLPSGCGGVVGHGKMRSFIGVQYLSGNVINVPNAAAACIFRDFSVYSPNGAMTGGAVINVTAAAEIVVTNVKMGIGGSATGVYVGIQCTTGFTRLTVADCYIQAEFRGIHLDNGYPMFKGVQVVNGRSEGTYIADSCSLYLKSITGGFITDWMQDAGGYAYGWYVDSTATSTNEVSCKGIYLDHFYVAGIEVPAGSACGNWQVTAFRLVDNSTLGTFCIQLAAAAVNWQFSTGSIDFGGRGVDISGASDILLNGVRMAPNKNNSAGVVINNSGTPKNIRILNCPIGNDDLGNGTTPQFGIFNDAPTLPGLQIAGCQISAATQAGKITLKGDEVNPKIANNPGISNVRKTVAAAATLTFPLMDDQDVIEITGSTALATAVAGLREGQQGVMVWTDAAPGAVSQVATIASPGFTPTRFQPYKFMFSNGKLYVG